MTGLVFQLAGVTRTLSQNLVGWLEEVVEHLRNAPNPSRSQADIDNFHNVGFSVTMALIAGYQNAHSEIKDFQAMFNTLKLTSRCELASVPKNGESHPCRFKWVVMNQPRSTGEEKRWWPMM